MRAAVLCAILVVGRSVVNMEKHTKCPPTKWEAFTTVQKGTIAEEFVQEKLEADGWVVYRPNGRHKIDIICEKNGKFWAVDVKAKARRIYYPDTGMDANDMEIYKQLPLPVYIIFVDDVMGMAYGASLEHLCIEREENGKKYPWIVKNYVYFPLSAMTMLWEITPEKIQELAEKTERKQCYSRIYEKGVI